MQCLKVILAFFVMLVMACAVPAQAGWTQLQDVPAGAALQTVGSDLYYISGTTIAKYNAGSDSWTAMTSSTRTGSIWGSNIRTAVATVGTDIYLQQRGQGLIEVYHTAAHGDFTANTWDYIDIPESNGVAFEYTQGAQYDPVSDVYWSWWTRYITTVGAAVDPSTLTISTPLPDPENTNYNTYLLWGGSQSVNVGDKNYVLNSGGTNPNLRYSIWPADGSFPLKADALYTSSGDLSGNTGGTGYDNVVINDGNLNADYACQMMAVSDGKIYIAGGGWSGAFMVYDPEQDQDHQWTILESYDNPAYLTSADVWNRHSMAAVDGVIYVENCGSFFAYSVPEPATMSLLGMGGLGLLIRRKRK